MSTVRGMPARAATRWWGKVSAKVAGLKAWHDQDAQTWAQSWDDGGAADKLGASVAEDVRRIIAEQTKEAVAEYAKDAEFALGAVNGQLMVGVNLTSAGGRLIVNIPLNELINKAVQDAWGSAGAPAGQEFIAAILKLTTDMAQLRRAMTQPAQSTDDQLPHERAVA